MLNSALLIPASPVLELLEDRTAPASLVFAQGGNLLSAGDEGYLAFGGDNSPLVKVTTGKALVFWDADAKTINGISVSNNVTLEIFGDVQGDIVTNLTSTGFLTDSNNDPTDGLDGGVLLASNISAITTNSYVDQFGVEQAGNVGRIIAGGSVRNVTLSGGFVGVTPGPVNAGAYAGDGIFDAVATSTAAVITESLPGTSFVMTIGFDFDSSGPLNATSMTLVKSDALFTTSPSISSVSFVGGQNVQFFAGDSDLRGGGSISRVNFTDVLPDPAVLINFFAGKAYTMSAGNGATSATTGGAGGSITLVTESDGAGDGFIAAGNGGAGAARGGVGGLLGSLDLGSTGIDYDIFSGNGGLGSSGGNGGSIRGIDISGASVLLGSGTGGNGTTGQGGSGGAISNPATFTNSLDVDVTPLFTATGDISIFGGDGGDTTGRRAGNGGPIQSLVIYDAANAFLFGGNGGDGTVGPLAVGGKGGNISGITAGDSEGLVSSSITGFFNLNAGDGGSSENSSGGSGGRVASVSSLNGGLVSAQGGDGGNAATLLGTGRGGDGGSVTSIEAVIENSGYAQFFAGNAGNSVGTAGARGGSVSGLSLTLNPNDAGAGTDDTLGVQIQGGNGGNGSSGGIGGGVRGVAVQGVYDQYSGDQTVLNYIAILISGGDGGNGTAGRGAAGGSVQPGNTFFGVSQIDPDSVEPDFLPADEGLRVFGGNGGTGSSGGGNGGSITAVRTANTLNSNDATIPFNLLGGAAVIAGDGGNTGSGNAGAGGSAKSLSIGVEGDADDTGNLRVEGGNGGNSGAGRGGTGGSISSSTLAAIKGNNDLGYAILTQAGDGGDGTTLAGKGGGISSLLITLPQVGVNDTDPDIYGAVILGGNGGDGTALSGSQGGTGGTVLNVRQTKDAFSVINLIQAGNGGNSSADRPGAVGGSVRTINTIGSVGAQDAKAAIGDPPNPQGLFNTVAQSPLIDGLFTTPDVQQGIFAGLGGSGSVSGANGAVSSIRAQAIAAIAAADRSGNFERAVSVSGVSTLLLAYDINGSGTYQAGDGFVLADQFTGLTSIDPSIVSTAALNARTLPFVNPI